MKIEIELIQQEREVDGETIHPGYFVKHEDKYADGLSYDEMLGLVSAIMMPTIRPTLNWLKTKEQRRNN